MKINLFNRKQSSGPKQSLINVIIILSMTILFIGGLYYYFLKQTQDTSKITETNMVSEKEFEALELPEASEIVEVDVSEEVAFVKEPAATKKLQLLTYPNSVIIPVPQEIREELQKTFHPEIEITVHVSDGSHEEVKNWYQSQLIGRGWTKTEDVTESWTKDGDTLMYMTAIADEDNAVMFEVKIGQAITLFVY